MTKQQTQEAIKVMQAYTDGEHVEYTYDITTWRTCVNPLWDWTNYDYRIAKPKPVKLAVGMKASCLLSSNNIKVLMIDNGYIWAISDAGNYGTYTVSQLVNDYKAIIDGKLHDITAP